MIKNTRFESIFRAISTPCVVLKPQDAHFLIVDANEAYLKITGSATEDLVGKKSCEAFPKNPALDHNGVDILLESFRKVATLKQNDTMNALRYDIPVRGTEDFLEKYWCLENIPVVGDSGELEYVLHTVRDVTARVMSEKKEQKLQQEAERNRQQFRHFVEANPNGLYSLDREGRFLNSNQALADMAEVPLEELLKMDFLPFCSAEDKEFILQHFQLALGGESVRFEAKFISAKGKELNLDLFLSPMKTEGEIIGIYGIARDFTPLRQSEKVVVTKKNYLQANAAFINSMLQNDLKAEDLQQPLGMIGEAVGVDRLYYYRSYPSRETRERLLSLKVEWTNDKAEPQIGRQEFQNFPVRKLEELIGRLHPNQPFTANVQELPEGELKQQLLSQKTKATLVLPIFLKEELFGIIGFDDCIRERHWTEEEIGFLKTLANNLTTTIEKRAADVALREQEEALRLSELKFKALVQESSDLYAILDLEGNYKFVSDSSSKILGLRPEEFYGRNAFEFIHPENQEYIRQQFSSLEMIRQFKLAPYRFRNKEGEWRWLETTLTNLTEDPAVQGVVGNSRDITRLLKQEREIRQINERYKMAATATQDLMYDWDLETDTVTRFHKGLSAFLGHPVTAVDQRHFWRDHIHSEELEDLIAIQKAALLDPEQDHINAEYRFRRADGSYAYLIDRAYIIRNPKGKAIRMVGATSDISQIKANLEALRISNKRFKLAMKATKEVIWDWDVTTGRVDRGKAFEKITGYDLKKGSRKPNFWFSKVHTEDRERAQSSLEAAIQDPEKRKWREEYRLIKADGETAYIIDRGFIVRDPSGKAIRMVGSALDVTESRMAMKRIRRQNELLREIAWDQSHLVRAPLARMKGLLELLEMGDTTVMGHHEIFQHLNRSYEELDRIVRSIVKKSEKVDQEGG